MDPARWKSLTGLLRNLNAALKTAALYASTHPSCVNIQATIHQTLEGLLRDQEDSAMGITADGLFVVEDTPWLGPLEQVKVLLARMRERDVGSITFLPGIPVEEVRLLLEALCADPAALAAEGGVGQVLAAKGARHLRATARLALDAFPETGSLDKRQVILIYDKAVGAARAVTQKVATGQLPAALDVRQVVEDILEGVAKDKYGLLARTLVKSYDGYLFHHSVNVATLAVALGHSLALEAEVLREVGFGAFLHDIGKVNWPESLSRKPRDLNAVEWALVRRHPLDGFKTLERMNTSRIAKSAVLEHHVRFDRSPQGYPTLPDGKEASLYGRLVAVVDSYDAMTTHRPHQRALEPSRAMASIRLASGTRYDPDLVDAFEQMMGVYPVGTLVRLNTRELAAVVRPQEDPARPLVRLVADADGTLLENGGEIDLRAKDPATQDYARSIMIPVDACAKNIDPANLLHKAAA